MLTALGRRYELLRGAATLYLVTTGVVFALLLSDLSADLQLTTPWVDTVLHRIMPMVVLLDWLLDPPHRTIRPRQAARWLIYPVVYLGYTLLRGPSAEWYPYPFLDPRPHGYGVVALTCAGIAVGIVALAGLTAWVGNRLRGYRATT